MDWKGYGGCSLFLRERKSRSCSEPGPLPAYRTGIRAGVWEARATASSVPPAGVFSIVSSALGYCKADSVFNLQGSRSPSVFTSCDLWKRQRLPAVTSPHGDPGGWLSLDPVGAYSPLTSALS